VLLIVFAFKAFSDGKITIQMFLSSVTITNSGGVYNLGTFTLSTHNHSITAMNCVFISEKGKGGRRSQTQLRKPSAPSHSVSRLVTRPTSSRARQDVLGLIKADFARLARKKWLNI
jgi:hypothetical protein